MDWLLELKLIRLFDFYLVLAFIAGTVLRIRQYYTILQLVRTFHGRWPHLFQLLKQHRTLLLTWGTILPLLLTLTLWIGHTILRRSLLSGDDLTLDRLLEMWLALPFVILCGLAMLGFDLYGIFSVAEVNRAELEKYFDQAEYWLRSWTAPVVRIFSFGFINPRKMVHVEVQKSLISAGQLINSSLWWMTVQSILRIVFGVSLWMSFALS